MLSISKPDPSCPTISACPTISLSALRPPPAGRSVQVCPPCPDLCRLLSAFGPTPWERHASPAHAGCGPRAACARPPSSPLRPGRRSQGGGPKAEGRRHKSGQGGQTWTLRPAGGGRRADKLMVGLALMVGQEGPGWEVEISTLRAAWRSSPPPLFVPNSLVWISHSQISIHCERKGARLGGMALRELMLSISKPDPSCPTISACPTISLSALRPPPAGRSVQVCPPRPDLCRLLSAFGPTPWERHASPAQAGCGPRAACARLPSSPLRPGRRSQGVGPKAERRRHKSGRGGQTWTLRPAGGGRRADKLMVGLALMVGQEGSGLKVEISTLRAAWRSSPPPLFVPNSLVWISHSQITIHCERKGARLGGMALRELMLSISKPDPSCPTISANPTISLSALRPPPAGRSVQVCPPRPDLCRLLSAFGPTPWERRPGRNGEEGRRAQAARGPHPAWAGLACRSQGVGPKAERRRHKSGRGGQTWTLRPAGGGRRADKLMVGQALMVGQGGSGLKVEISTLRAAWRSSPPPLFVPNSLVWISHSQISIHCERKGARLGGMALRELMLSGASVQGVRFWPGRADEGRTD
jgi:hypothetical protein